MKQPIIECVRSYIMEFPDLKDGCFLVDFLGSQPIEYGVETIPCDPVFKKYTDGTCMKQFLFVFASREFYSENVSRQLENSAFYEHFEDWITERNFNGILPDLGDTRCPVSVEVVTGGYVFDADTNSARYQIQMRLLYEEV
ncbi:MAG: hypothetical protein K2J08_08375 [Ruminococcus sp.]|nr:hypothetical protein [Ruminococcus sp.]